MPYRVDSSGAKCTTMSRCEGSCRRARSCWRTCSFLVPPLPMATTAHEFFHVLLQHHAPAVSLPCPFHTGKVDGCRRCSDPGCLVEDIIQGVHAELHRRRRGPRSAQVASSCPPSAAPSTGPSSPAPDPPFSTTARETARGQRK